MTNLGAVDLDSSAGYQGIEGRLEQSQAVVDAMRARGDLPLGELLTRALEAIVSRSGLDGMMIASEDGLPVAVSHESCRSELLAAIGCLFDSTVQRAQGEGLMHAVEEMTLRGHGGEQIVVRYFTTAGRRFVLVAYSSQPCAYRRATAKALAESSDLLARASGEAARKRRHRKVPVRLMEKDTTHNGQSNQA